MKRKPILMNNKKGLLDGNQKIIIGIVGTHRGAGVTHLSVMLANYLNDLKGKKVALLECNNHKDFFNIQMEYEGKTKKGLDKKRFQIFDVTYYKNVQNDEIADIINEDYDYIIQDFGIDFVNNSSEFLRCNSKLVVSSLCDWKRHYLYQFIHIVKDVVSHSSWEYLILFGDKSDLKDLKYQMNVRVNEIPFEPDPFHTSKETLNLFQRFG